ncbi:MAG: trk/ktr system potassium uptake protein [Candidatus Poribacteria bacterium]|nr:trk/ktr system potassium uptake protein [Candidatus Poribacteria bacterium]
MDYEKFRLSSTRILNIVLVFLTILSVISLIIELGDFEISPTTQKDIAILNWIVVFIFVADTFVRWAINKFELAYLRKHLPDFILTFSFLLLLIVVFGYSPTSMSNDWMPLFIDLTIARVFIVLSRLYIVGSPIFRILRKRSQSSEPKLAPTQLFVISFAFVILIGTGLLLLPEATNTGSINVVDALFTAASATCVTGLIVVDTGSYFTFFGQLVTMILIQVGGLGLMTVTTFFSLIGKRGMSVRESVFMSSAMNIKSLSKVSNLIISTLIVTLSFEAIGALFLYIDWAGFGRFEWGSVVYYSIYHSISAFCNAGFSLFANNLEDFKGDIIVNMTITLLIIFGGLGFIVIMNLLHYFRFGIFKKERLTLHTKLILLVTGVLIVDGMLLIIATEWNNGLANLPLSTKLQGAYFQSVTPRTAGFNTINITHLTNACYFMTIILMFKGASPGGTGGGIKTSTFGIFIGSILSMLKGRTNVEIFKRSIPKETVTNALLLTTLTIMLLAVFSFILLVTEDFAPIHVFFELVSAFGTVGLSAGITSNLTTIGKLIITATMFIGRVGPMTLMLAISQLRQQRRSVEYEYPEENVMIG